MPFGDTWQIPATEKNTDQLFSRWLIEEDEEQTIVSTGIRLTKSLIGLAQDTTDAFRTDAEETERHIHCVDAGAIVQTRL